MTQDQINKMVTEAMQRIQHWINRSAGQHQRAMREKAK